MWISLDGNIGSGKTTIANKFKEIGYIVFFEETHKWEEDGWIQKYYQNIDKYAGYFQLRIILSHLSISKKIKEIQSNNPNAIIITERSFFSSQEVFGKMLLDDKILEDMIFKLCGEFKDLLFDEPDLFIYLDCSPQECINRIEKRNRKGESNISLDYLEKVDRAYQTFIKEHSSIVIKSHGEIDDIFNNIIEKI